MDKKRTAFANRICNEKSYLQMELLSDLHIAFPRQNAKLEAALEDIWKRKVRHVAICGDLTNNGYPFQMKQVLTQLQEFPIHILPALGNHDLSCSDSCLHSCISCKPFSMSHKCNMNRWSSVF